MATTTELLDSIIAQASRLRGLCGDEGIESWEHDRLEEVDNLLDVLLEDMEED